MPVHLLHQNMRAFGGGAGARNAAYNAQLLNVAGRLAMGDRIAVCGLTEILNNNTAANVLGGGGGQAFNLAGQLGANTTFVVGCGQTALNNQAMEYVCIGVHPTDAANLVGIGRIMIKADQNVQLLDDYIAVANYNANWANNTPPQATFDYRGLVYVTLAINALPIAVGFLHNRYGSAQNGGQAERAMIAQQLPRMAYLLDQRLGIGNVYIGGDFNVNVIATRSLRGTDIFAYSRATTAIPPPPPPPPPPPTKQQAPVGATSGGTTWAGSLYDYWYTSIDPAAPPPAGLIVPIADVDTDTLDTAIGYANGGVMSDHCAALLRII